MIFEFTVLASEINPVINSFEDHNVDVTAVHNHWVLQHPTLYFLHAEKTGDLYTLLQDAKDAPADVKVPFWLTRLSHDRNSVFIWLILLQSILQSIPDDVVTFPNVLFWANVSGTKQEAAIIVAKKKRISFEL